MVVQVALALVLLVGSGLMIRTFAAMRTVPPGTSNVRRRSSTLRLSIPRAQIPEAEKVERMQQAILEKIAALPGVASAGLATNVTMDGSQPLRSHLCRRPSVLRLADSADAPLQEHRPRLLRNHGQPRARRTQHHLERHLRRAPRGAGVGEFRPRYWGDPSGAIGKRIRESTKGMWREIIASSAMTATTGSTSLHHPPFTWPILLKGMFGQTRPVGAARHRVHDPQPAPAAPPASSRMCSRPCGR